MLPHAPKDRHSIPEPPTTQHHALQQHPAAPPRIDPAWSHMQTRCPACAACPTHPTGALLGRAHVPTAHTATCRVPPRWWGPPRMAGTPVQRWLRRHTMGRVHEGCLLRAVWLLLNRAHATVERAGMGRLFATTRRYGLCILASLDRGLLLLVLDCAC